MIIISASFLGWQTRVAAVQTDSGYAVTVTATLRVGL